MGYQRAEADHAVFVRMRGTLSIIALYVDDITMVSNTLETINQDKTALRESYEMTDLGDISWIMGCMSRARPELAFDVCSFQTFVLTVVTVVPNRFNGRTPATVSGAH